MCNTSYNKNILHLIKYIYHLIENAFGRIATISAIAHSFQIRKKENEKCRKNAMNSALHEQRKEV